MCYRSKIPNKSPLVLSEEMRLIITLLFSARGRGSIHIYLLWGVWESNAGISARWSPLPCAFPASLKQSGVHPCIAHGSLFLGRELLGQIQQESASDI